MLRTAFVHGRLAQKFAFGAALVAALALSACKKKDGGTETPGGSATSAEDIAKQIEQAKADAKVAGLVDLANKDLQNGRYVSATKLAEAALEDDDRNANAYAVIGAAGWRAGDFDASTAAFEKAIEIEPTNYGAALGLARNYQVIGRDPEAIELLDRVLKEDSKQLEPHLAKLWSHYTLLDADGAVKDADAIFLAGIKEDDPIVALIQTYAAYMRPLAGKGPFCTVEGKGTSSLGIDPASGVKFAGAVVGGEFTQVVLAEIFEENIVDPAFAKAAKLKAVGKFKPLGRDAEVDIVIIPEVKLGDFVMKNVPAYVGPLSDYSGMVGETPGLRLGRQALLKIGAIRYDFPAFSVAFTAEAPTGPPDGAVEVPLLLVSWHLQHAPVVPIQLKGSEHTFYAYLGGLYASGLSISKKHYLKSGFLPRHIDPPDDVEQGLKMVYIDGFTLGGQAFAGAGGLVLVNEPPDATIRQFLENAAFEIGGLINVNMMKNWKITYALSSGKLFIER
ncbi:MAG: tetratricopeptide repeat protein [Nannocystaceae bacterium]|nr:tetratricopeptide repeat protein [Nannocystaceae bacterium]